MAIEQRYESRHPAEIKPYDRNPRKNDESIEDLAKIIEDVGFLQPIAVDEDGIILAGHARQKAALHLGLQEVPLVVVTGLTPGQKVAYRIADNRLNERAEWDSGMLALELDRLAELDVDPELSGFHMDEIKDLTALLSFDPNASPTSADPITGQALATAADGLASQRAASTQDLVEVICPHCAETFEVSAREIAAQI